MHLSQKYRFLINTHDLIDLRIQIKETDILIRSDRNMRKRAKDSLIRVRRIIEDYIRENPRFQRSLIPVLVGKDAHPILREMTAAACLCGVGPFAAVAGAVAQMVGQDLSSFSSEIIVENGGDIYIYSKKKRIIGIFLGKEKPYYKKLGIEISPEDTPMGVAASSGIMGRSISFGKAAAAVILARTAILADAAATALANRVYQNDQAVLEEAGRKISAVPGVFGHLIISGKYLEAGGKIKLVSL